MNFIERAGVGLFVIGMVFLFGRFVLAYTVWGLTMLATPFELAYRKLFNRPRRQRLSDLYGPSPTMKTAMDLVKYVLFLVICVAVGLWVFFGGG